MKENILPENIIEFLNNNDHKISNGTYKRKNKQKLKNNFYSTETEHSDIEYDLYF
jgi:hypothetical protein